MVSDIPAGDGKTDNIFLQCPMAYLIIDQSRAFEKVYSQETGCTAAATQYLPSTDALTEPDNDTVIGVLALATIAFALVFRCPILVCYCCRIS